MAFLEGTLRLSSHVSKLRGHDAVHMLIRAALKPKNLFKNLLADDWDFEGVIDAVAHPEALVGKRIRWNRYEDLRADYDPDVGPPGARISDHFCALGDAGSPGPAAHRRPGTAPVARGPARRDLKDECSEASP